ncbi:hypothetical protein ACOAKG_04090 [Streptomyces sp. JL3001]|uniref:hypothetical protein n=1 Tax=Streptomyces sp. JL3001 TaxID=3400923 RepID=UPI003B27D2B7
MRRLVYYVAATLDSYIAGPNGEYDFLLFEGEGRDAILAEYPETMPTPARAAFGLTDTPNRHFDTVIMGRGTYEPGLRAGMTSPHAHPSQCRACGRCRPRSEHPPRTLASPERSPQVRWRNTRGSTHQHAGP